MIEEWKVRSITSDAERKTVSRKMRAYRPQALRRRYRMAAIVVFLLSALLLGIFFHYFLSVVDYIYAVCVDWAYVEDETGFDRCFAQRDTAQAALRYVIYSLLALLVLYIHYVSWIYQSAWRANYRSLDGREFIYGIGKQGFTVEEEGRTQHHYHWAAVERIVEESGMLLFFVDQCVAHFIPIRAFKSADEAAQFLKQAQAWRAESVTQSISHVK